MNLLGLINNKIDLINILIESETRLNQIKLNESDMNVFSIQSLKQLTGKRKNYLKDCKDNTSIKRDMVKILDQLDSLDVEIRISLIDLLIEKINVL